MVRFSTVGTSRTFTIAQLSDPHLSSLNGVRFRDLLSKRVLGYLSWRVNRRATLRGEVLSALVEDLHVTRPDHTVITGDLTHLGLPFEYQQVKAWLGSLGPPAAVTLVPGNHDTYVQTRWEDTLALWEPYMNSDTDDHECFPSVRVRGCVALIGLSTARPAGPFLAIGTLGAAQLQRLQHVLLETGRHGLFRVVFMHHPPVVGVVPWRRRLTDADAFCATVRRCGAELILHGHAHQTSIASLQGPHGAIPAIGVPSASSLSRNAERRARYHLYSITPRSSGWELKIFARGYADSERGFSARGEIRLV